MRGILNGFGCDFDVQDAVVDGEAHKDDPYGHVLINARAPGHAKRQYRGRTQLRRGRQPDGSPLSCESAWDTEEAGPIAFCWHVSDLGNAQPVEHFIFTHKHSVENGSMARFLLATGY